MFVKKFQEIPLLNVDDNFFDVIDVHPNGDVVAEITYAIKQSDAVRLNTTKVKIDVYTKPTTRSFTSNHNLPMHKPKQVAAHVLQLASSIKQEIKSNKSAKTLLKTFYSDITAKLNNELVSAFVKHSTNTSLEHFSLYRKRIVYKSVDELARENSDVPIFAKAVVSGSGYAHTANDIAIAMLNLAYKGVDPASAEQYSNHNVSTYHAMHGIAPDDYQLSDDPNMHKVIDYYIGNQSTIASSQGATENLLIPTVTQEYSDLVAVREVFVIPLSRLKTKPTEVTVYLHLLTSKHITMDMVTRQVDLAKHINFFYTPRKAPEVMAYNLSENGRGIVKITCRDKKTSGVRVYKKVLNHSYHEYGNYVLIAEQAIEHNKTIAIPVEASDTNATIFRVVPIGKNRLLGTCFSSAIIKPKMANNSRRSFCFLATKPVKSGIQLEIFEIPPHVVSFQVMRIDKTTHEKTATCLGNTAIFAGEENEVYQYVDRGVKDGHLYEYYLQLTMDNGLTKKVAHSTVEYIPLIDDLVDTVISSVKSTDDDKKFDVTFAMKSTLNDSDLTNVKNMLKAQGILSFFSDDILNERSKLEQLLAHAVTRINLTTGQKEDFGVIVGEEFSDRRFAKINAVNPIQLGHRYRYEVYACLRSPESMLASLKKKTTDTKTKRDYSFRPAVYRHPLALKHGNITNEQTLKAYHAKSSMTFGMVGNIADIEISFAEDTLVIEDAIVHKFEKDANLLRWEVKGNKDLIDHFVIVKECLGIRTIIGKTHTHSSTNSMQFVHHLERTDAGQFFYYIIPVFNNYRLGTVLKTNDVIV